MRAWILVAATVFACGDSTNSSPSDAAKQPDAGTPPLDINAVTVTITSNGSARAGVKAYFTSADNATTTMRETDSTGLTGYDLGSGGFVTVVDPFGKGSDSHHVIRSWAGVVPRDALMLDDEPGTPITFGLGVVAVPSGYEYDVTTLCDGNTGNGMFFASTGSATTASGEATATCETPDIYISVQGSDGTLLATQWHPASAVGSGSIDLTGSAFSPVASASYAFTGLPAGSTSRFDVEQINADGTIFTGGLPNATLLPPSANASVLQSKPFAQLTQLVDTVIITPSNQHDVQTWSQTGSTSYALDASELLLPDITAAPVYDFGSATLSWTSGNGAEPDAMFIQLQFVGDSAIDSWELIAPYNAGSAQFPVISGLAPVSTDTVQTLVQTIKFGAGYDSFRARYYVGSTARRFGSGEALFQVRTN